MRMPPLSLVPVAPFCAVLFCAGRTGPRRTLLLLDTVFGTTPGRDTRGMHPNVLAATEIIARHDHVDLQRIANSTGLVAVCALCEAGEPGPDPFRKTANRR